MSEKLSETRREQLEFIIAIMKEIKSMATHEKVDMVAFLLSMAILEAEEMLPGRPAATQYRGNILHNPARKRALSHI